MGPALQGLRAGGWAVVQAGSPGGIPPPPRTPSGALSSRFMCCCCWTHGLVILASCFICRERRHMSKKPDKTEMLSVPKKEWERWKFSGFSHCGQGWGQVCVWEAGRAAEGAGNRRMSSPSPSRGASAFQGRYAKRGFWSEAGRCAGCAAGSGRKVPQLLHAPAPWPVCLCPRTKHDTVFTRPGDLPRAGQVWDGLRCGRRAIVTRPPAPACAPTLRATLPPPRGAHTWPADWSCRVGHQPCAE